MNSTDQAPNADSVLPPTTTWPNGLTTAECNRLNKEATAEANRMADEYLRTRPRLDKRGAC